MSRCRGAPASWVVMARVGWHSRWSALLVLVVAACGPTAEPQWSFAVLRAVEGGTYPDAQVWLVDDAGQERAVPVPPAGDDGAAPIEWIGWTPDGAELVLRRANVLWRWDGERFADAPFVSPQFDVGRVRDGHVLEDGSVAATIRVSGGVVPGYYAWDRWSLAFADPSGSPEILADANGLVSSVGAGPTLLWTESRYLPDSEMQVSDEPEIHRSHRMLRGGLERDIDGPADTTPIVSPTGEHIAWLGAAAVVVTDLEGREEHRIEAPADVIAWSPEADRLAGSSDGDVWRYTFDSAALEPLGIAESRVVAWSPDSEALAIETACDTAAERRIRVIDDGSELWSSPCGSHFFAGWSPDGARIATRAVRVFSSTAGPTRIHTIGGELGPEVEGGFLAFRPQ